MFNYLGKSITVKYTQDGHSFLLSNFGFRWLWLQYIQRVNYGDSYRTLPVIRAEKIGLILCRLPKIKMASYKFLQNFPNCFQIEDLSLRFEFNILFFTCYMCTQGRQIVK